jgi:hypothetical protein
MEINPTKICRIEMDQHGYYCDNFRVSTRLQVRHQEVLQDDSMTWEITNRLEIAYIIAYLDCNDFTHVECPGSGVERKDTWIVHAFTHLRDDVRNYL